MKNCAIILAAGIGSRLKKATENYPKCLLKVCEKTILDYQILGYKNIGVENIFIISGHQHEKIQNFCNEKKYKIKFIKNENYISTNNMVSLYLGLKEAINENYDNVFISNADCIYEKEIFEELNKYTNCFAGKKDVFIEESMKAVCQNENIIDISKNITPENSYGVTLDLYKLDNKSIKLLFSIINSYIIKKELNLWSEVALKDLCKLIPIKFIDMKNLKWYEIDNSIDYVEAIKLFSTAYQHKKTHLFDIDGTLFTGKAPIYENIKLFEQLNNNNNKKVFIVSNNTSKTSIDYLNKFNNVQIKIKHKQVLTPLLPLINYINNNNLKNIYVLANKKVKKLILSKTNSINDDKNPQAVVMCYDNEITYEKLSKAALLLKDKNILFLATHEDKRCPTELGYIPDIGCYLETIKLTISRTPDKIFGKPNIEIIDAILSKHKVSDIVFYGDRLYTDGLLSYNTNINFCLCLSGETTKDQIYHLIDNGNIDQIPTYII